MTTARAVSPYLKLEQQIASGERGSILRRWRYGRNLMDAKAGRKQLPEGMLDDLVKAADKVGLKLSRQEIQRRLRCAETYRDDRQVRQAADALGSWSALVNAGFPKVESDEPEDTEAAGVSTAAPDEYEQLSLIPGLAPTLSVAGRKIPLADATVADIAAYRDMYAQIHTNYGKRLALIEAALAAMREGCGGDEAANAVEAWQRGTGDDEPEATNDGEDGDS